MEMLARMPYFRDIALNSHVVIFASTLSMIVGVVVCLIPMTRMPIREASAGLQDGSRGSAAAMWRRAGAPLVIAELAIAMMLLVSARLLGRRLYRLLHVNTGQHPASGDPFRQPRVDRNEIADGT